MHLLIPVMRIENHTEILKHGILKKKKEKNQKKKEKGNI